MQMEEGRLLFLYIQSTHSAYFCRACKLKMDTYIKRNVTSTRNEGLDNIWLAYNNDTSALCDVCLHHQALTAGGRFKPPSRPSPVLKEVSEHIQIVFALHIKLISTFVSYLNHCIIHLFKFHMSLFKYN